MGALSTPTSELDPSTWLRLISDGAPDYAICTLDPSGRITSWNSGAIRTHGYSEAEVLSNEFSRIYVSEDIQRGKPQADLAHAAEHGRYEVEHWRIRRDGSCFWAHIIITALYDSDHNVRGFCQVIRDATERKQLEALEEDRRKVLELIAQDRPLADVLGQLILMLERQYP